MKDLWVRPFEESDREVLEQARAAFTAAVLENPHDFMNPQVETAVCTKEGKVVTALTGTIAVILDPLIRVPGYKAEEYLSALFKLEAILTYLAQKELNAVDAYIAIPEGVTEEEKAAAAGYERIVRRCGYEPTVEFCKVFRRSLVSSKKKQSDKLGQVEPVEPAQVVTHEKGAEVSQSEQVPA